MHKICSHKYPALDSLRGIAALIVCCRHYILINNSVDYMANNITPWGFLNAGRESVLFFFLLSGFLLCSMLEKTFQKTLKYNNFIFRRVLRLYPAYYCALFFSIIIHLYITPYPISQLTDWFNSYANTTVEYSSILKSLFLIWGGGNGLDNVTWSLTYEMLISLIFPIFIMLIYNQKPIKNSIAYIFKKILILIIFLIFVKKLDIDPVSLMYYSSFFIIGIILFKYKNHLQFAANNKFLIVGIMLYFFKFLTFGKIFHNQYIYDEITTLGASTIIINGIYNNFFINILHTKILKFYGRISYSFYLIHLPTMYACVYILYNNKGIKLITVKAIAFCLSSLFAWILYTHVELKSINFSKRWNIS